MTTGESYAPSSEFRTLYTIFTGESESIGARLNATLGERSNDAPLIVATGTDVVIFPGSGRAPLRESFRKSTRGFTEMTAISHLGVAVPYIIRLRELGHAHWRSDTLRLMAQCRAVQAVNTIAYWRDTVDVAAWRGWEEKIVDLVDYSCDVTCDYLQSGLADPRLLTFPTLRERFLDPVGSAAIPVPMNDMMAATFALVFLDIAHRILGWFAAKDVDWTRAMVLLSGRAGRPTAGLTWQSNSMCHLLWRASGETLSADRLFIAPHAPELRLQDLDDPAQRGDTEAAFRTIWYSTRTTMEMGRLMYEAYPAFRPPVQAAPVVNADTDVLDQLPMVRSAADRRAIMTRLRFVMEDPGQQLANASAQFMVDQLAENGNRPEAVVVPGFTETHYPRRSPRRS